MFARRRSVHRFLNKRQYTPLTPTSLPFVPGFQPTTTTTALSSSSQPSTTTTPLIPPGSTSTLTTTSSSTQATSTSSGTIQTFTSTSSSTSASTSASSTPSTPSSTPSSSTALRAPTTRAQQPAYSQPSYTSYTYAGLTPSSSAPSATSSSSSTTGGMSIGTLVGIVAGGFFGIMIVLILGTYIARWYRRHSAERDFTDEYNEPTPEPALAPAGGRAKEDIFGRQMSQRVPSPSLVGGAGLAGQGIMASRAMPIRGYGGGYGGYPNVDEEVIGGAYSSQPQPQMPYNPEAYGAYVSYDAAAGYQDAMRGYQGQRTFEQPINYGYAISEDPIPMQPAPAPVSPPPAPAPSTSPRPILAPASPPRTTPSAALAAAHAAAATVHAPAPAPAPAPVLHDTQDGQRKSALYTEDDAYAGF